MDDIRVFRPLPTCFVIAINERPSNLIVTTETSGASSGRESGAVITSKAEIAAAFPANLPPQPITTCDCEECQDIRANLGNLRWVDVLPPAANQTFGSLPLLTDEAFQALLPALLFRALEDINDEN